MRAMVQNPFRHVILLMGSLILSLGIAELVLRWNPPAMVYMNTRNIVQQTHSEVSPNPVLGYIPRANLSKNFSNREFHTRITINSKSMRGQEYALQKPEGIRRIAVMGDSFVFGWGVDDGEVFTEILEKRYLKNVEVLNFGVSGYNAGQSLERLRVEAARFNPDIALLFLYGFPEGDPSPRIEFRNGKLYWALPERMTLWDTIKRFSRRNIYLFTFLEEVRGWFIEKFFPSPPLQEEPYPGPEESEKGMSLLSDFQKLAAQKGFLPVVVFIPNKWDLLDSEMLKKDFRGIRMLEGHARETGLIFWDLTPSLQAAWKSSGQMPYFKYDDHWNKWGHECTAKVLAKRLKDESFLTEGFFQAASGS